MRLLTDEEIEQVMVEEFRRVQGREAPIGYFAPSINDRAIANAQDKATLKAVGGFLESKRAGRTMADGKMALVKEIPDENWVCFLTDEDIETLKRGEMPEEKP